MRYHSFARNLVGSAFGLAGVAFLSAGLILFAGRGSGYTTVGMKQSDLEAIAKFIFEAGILSKTPRSGLWFLGTGRQTVAEHSLRATMIGYALAYLTPRANTDKVLRMCLFHDIGEGRTSDLNYVHQRYGRLAEAEAIRDISRAVPFGKEVARLFEEFEARKSVEARLVRDADQLEWIATLRDEQVKGNSKANAWAKIAMKRLKTAAGKQVGKFLMSTHPDAWYFSASDRWFIDRKPRHRKWRKQP